jgi:hypothetical protein
MKTKLLVCFSTNRDEAAYNKFTKEIKQSIGLKQKKADVDMQDGEFDIITIYNDGRYSLSEAYNRMWREAKEETKNFDNYIMVFIHHDIHFKSNGWGKNLLNIYNENDVNIIGLAGTDKFYEHGVWWLDSKGQFNKNDLWGKVWHTDGKKEWKSDFTTPEKKCAKLQPVVVIDGVFIAVDPITTHMFDEDFGGFHYYDISFCVDNFLFGSKIYVTETIQIVHESGGQLSQAWEDSRFKLTDIYKQNLPLKIS